MSRRHVDPHTSALPLIRAGETPQSDDEDRALRALLRAELEETRSRFHALVATVSHDGWKTPSGNPAWTNGQTLWHVAIGVRFANTIVKRVARGRGVNPPMWLFNPLNARMGRIGALRATPASVVRTYDRGIDGVLRLLEQIPREAWEQYAMVLGERTLLEDVFHGVRWHYETHAADMR